MGPLVHVTVQAEGMGCCSLGHVGWRPIVLLTEKNAQDGFLESTTTHKHVNPQAYGLTVVSETCALCR